MWGHIKKQWAALTIAFVACLSGLAVATATDTRGVEIDSNFYLVATSTLVVASMAASSRRLHDANDADKLAIKILPMLAVLAIVAWVVCGMAGLVDSYGPERVAALFLVFIPYARMQGDGRDVWGTVAGVFGLLFVLVPALIVGSRMGTSSLVLTIMAIVVMLANVALLFKPPSVAIAKRLDTLVLGTVMFFIGMTLIDGSYAYDWKAAVFVGSIMAIVGFGVSAVFEKFAGVKMSYLMGTTNLVIALWLGSFMAGAGVIALVALVAGWLVHLASKSTSDWWARRRVERQAQSD